MRVLKYGYGVCANIYRYAIINKNTAGNAQRKGERMALENLYQCTMKDLTDLPQRMAEAFQDHPLFFIAFPKAETRHECLVYFFEQYLSAIAPDSMFLADSEELNTIMIVCDSRRYEHRQYLRRLAKMNLKFLYFIPRLGIRHCISLIRNWDMFSSRWLKDFERDKFFHLDGIFTRKEMRGQGKGEAMIRELLDEGEIMDMDISAEAHEKRTALWLEKMGFVLMNTIVDEESDLYQYCLIARHHKEQKSWIQSIE